jgi:hypothetical protein
MKISVTNKSGNEKELFTLSDVQCKVICNDIHQDEFEADMERRLQYILMHKYEQCFKRLKEEWEPKLCDRMDAVPTHPDKLAELIFAQPDYKCRKQREDEVVRLSQIPEAQ